MNSTKNNIDEEDTYIFEDFREQSGPCVVDCQCSFPFSRAFMIFDTTSDESKLDEDVFVDYDIDVKQSKLREPILREYSALRKEKKSNPNEIRIISCASLYFVSKMINGEAASKTPDDIFDRISCYAIIDGHGGEACAEYIENSFVTRIVENLTAVADFSDIPMVLSQVLEATLITLEIGYREIAKTNKDKSGACIVAALYLEGWFCVSNIGDSAAVFFDCFGRETKMSTEHSTKNKKEFMRIFEAGGKIGKTGYIQRELKPSRSIGDYEFKDKYPGLLISAPSTKIIKVNTESKRYIPALVLVSTGLSGIGENTTRTIRQHTELWRQNSDLQPQLSTELTGCENPAFSLLNHLRGEGSNSNAALLFLQCILACPDSKAKVNSEDTTKKQKQKLPMVLQNLFSSPGFLRKRIKQESSLEAKKVSFKN